MNSNLLLPALLLLYVAWRLGSSWRARRVIPQLVRSGAQLVDVRSSAEYAAAHAQHSTNIPLHELDGSVAQLDPQRWVVVCCASGSRSATARRLLRRRGFAKVFNAGSWRNLP